MNDNLETVQLLPLTSDIVFKQVFGQEESKPILRVFLNDVLGLDIQSSEQITLLNPIIDPKYLDDKMCILDVRVQLSDRSLIDIEIQVLTIWRSVPCIIHASFVQNNCIPEMIILKLHQSMD